MEKRLVTKDDIVRYKREIYMIKSLDHPNIVNVKEYFEDKERIYVCLEYLKGGELFVEVN
jgi:calcium-dependent protein kinase